jgi:FkbM family methyltransferase
MTFTDLWQETTLEVRAWNALRLVLRQGTVDQDNLNWMQDNIFWRIFLDCQIGEQDTLLDLGSHIGAFSLRASAHSGCSVWAAEPHPESCRLHRVNAALNGLQHRQTICEAAVSELGGEVILHEAVDNWAHTTLGVPGEYNVLTGHTRRVPSLSLRGVLEAAGLTSCPLMKINVEGAEFAFLRGASLADLKKIGAIVAELHFDLAPGETGGGLLDPLRQAGFSASIVDPNSQRGFLVARR